MVVMVVITKKKITFATILPFFYFFILFLVNFRLPLNGSKKQKNGSKSQKKQNLCKTIFSHFATIFEVDQQNL